MMMTEISGYSTSHAMSVPSALLTAPNCGWRSIFHAMAATTAGAAKGRMKALLTSLAKVRPIQLRAPMTSLASSTAPKSPTAISMKRLTPVNTVVTQIE